MTYDSEEFQITIDQPNQHLIWEQDCRRWFFGFEWDVFGGERHIYFCFFPTFVLHWITLAPDPLGKVGDLVKLRNGVADNLSFGEIWEVVERAIPETEKVEKLYKVYFDLEQVTRLFLPHQVVKVLSDRQKLENAKQQLAIEN